MRAVNQSIGRSFRNISDYAAVVLLDERYSEYAKLLPEWIQRSFSNVADWESVINMVTEFFANKT
jgi:Rad3-related DNA helicase